MRKSLVLGNILIVCLLVAASAWGQGGTNSGTIAGEVDDSSGAKISGAKVEVASPAMIERVRDTVTGDDGLFKIVNLPPGVYTVTATQEGFSTVRRENIEITTGFTANVNFALTPGSVQQTVTVTTQAPVLDTQDSVVQKIISNTVLESLPIGNSQANFPSLIPGAVASATFQDVGGLKGETSQGFRIHGTAASDYQLLQDGMAYDTGYTGGGNQNTSNNSTATQELQFETGGYSAEDWYLGGHVNIIPKNGGNQLHGSFLADYGNKALQATNLTPALNALGVTSAASIRGLYQFAGGVGGPIKKDKLWFFAEARDWLSSSTQSGPLYYYDVNEFAPFPNNLFYQADQQHPAYDYNTYLSVGLRLTWQATTRNKFTESWINQANCNCFYTITTSNAAPNALTGHSSKPDWQQQATWTFPVNNKLLLWAGMTAIDGTSSAEPPGWHANSGLPQGGGGAFNPNDVPISDTSHGISGAGFIYGADGSGEGASAVTDNAPLDFLSYNENFTASYVSGPHAFKFGYSDKQERNSLVHVFPNLNGATAPAAYMNLYPNGVELQLECRPVAVAGSGGGAIAPTALGAGSIQTSMNPTFQFNNQQTYGLPIGAYEIPTFSNGAWTNVQFAPITYGTGGAGQLNPNTINSLGCPTVNLGPSASQTTFLQTLLPYQVSQFLSPLNWKEKIEAHAIFGQDQWRIKRLTMNLGMRFDWFTAGDQAQCTPANPQFGLPAKCFSAQSNVIDWKSLNPRLGAAYDLFGNGKTAIKASFARGIIAEYTSGMTTLTNPVTRLANSTTRSFNDLNSDFNPSNNVGGTGWFNTSAFGPGCSTATAATTLATCELGATSSTGGKFYSQANAAAVAYGNDVVNGWNTEPSEWQFSASVQQEVIRGVAVTFDFYRTWVGNQMVARNNVPLAALNFDQYCVTPPASNAAFPGFGGTQVCNLYDPVSTPATASNPATFTVEKASAFGGVSDIYTGMDLLANARFHGLVLQGGVSAGHEVTNYCVEVNSPQDLTYWTNESPTTTSIAEFGNNNDTAVNTAIPCAITPPWSQNLQFKMAVVYTLPWQGIKISANEQNLPSIPLAGAYSYTASNVTFPCAATSTCNDATNHGATPKLNGPSASPKLDVVTPQSLYPYGRNNQLDFRVSKVFTIKERWKIEPTADFYNLLNANSILSINTGYNSTAPGSGGWRSVSSLLPARLIKFGVHVDF